MSRGAWIAVAVVVGILVLGGGTVAVVVLTDRQKFLRAIRDAFRAKLDAVRPDLSAELREKAARIVAAQAAFESGYGRSEAYRQAFNFGNVSAGSSWKGPTIAGGDKEYDAAGNVKQITQRWRAYMSLWEAVDDFWSLLGWTRYQKARAALLRGDADGYAAELRAGGYYTAPLNEYVAGVSSALKGFA